MQSNIKRGNKTMSAIANKIRSKMLEQGISAHALEKKAGLRPSSVHNILQGKSKNPTLHTIQALSHALGCSLDEMAQDKQAAQLSNEPWNATLYQDATKVASELFSENKLEPTKQQALNYIEEIYNYASLNRKKSVDRSFAEWLITKKWY